MFDLDIDLDELEFDGAFDLYMDGPDGSGGIGQDGELRDALSDALAFDAVQDDPLNGDVVDSTPVAPMYDDYGFESALDVDRRLLGARMDSDDRA